MAQSGFFPSNANRAFPFLKGSVGLPASGPLTLANLPDSAVVDCGFVCSAKSRFDAGVHSVRLAQVRRVADTFFFDFACDAPELAGVPITFVRHADDGDFLTEHSDTGEAGLSESGSDSSDPVGDCEEPLWSGYMVSGGMADLALFLTGDGSVSGDAVVEPALVQSLAGGYVTSLNLANDDRTRVSSADDCDAVVWPYETGVVFVNARCLVGGLVFTAGYNAVVRQSARDNSLTFGAAVGSGAGQPCSEVALFGGEVAPGDGVLLSGGPRCNEILRSVNGQGGRLFNLTAGNGVVITSLPGENRLVVDVNMSGLALCYNNLSQVSESL